VIHFGLGRFAGPVSDLRIQWPSGLTQVLRDVATRRTITVVEQP
jgi:hypothetical protein